MEQNKTKEVKDSLIMKQILLSTLILIVSIFVSLIIVHVYQIHEKNQTDKERIDDLLNAFNSIQTFAETDSLVITTTYDIMSQEFADKLTERMQNEHNNFVDRISILIVLFSICITAFGIVVPIVNYTVVQKHLSSSMKAQMDTNMQKMRNEFNEKTAKFSLQNAMIHNIITGKEHKAQKEAPKEPEESKGISELLDEIIPISDEPIDKAQAFYLRARLRKKDDDAIADLTEAIALIPKNTEDEKHKWYLSRFHSFRSNLYFHKEKYPEALKDIEKTIKLDSEHTIKLNSTKARNHYQRGRTLCKMANAFDSKSPINISCDDLLESKKDCCEKALKAFCEAIKIEDGNDKYQKKRSECQACKEREKT